MLRDLSLFSMKELLVIGLGLGLFTFSWWFLAAVNEARNLQGKEIPEFIDRALGKLNRSSDHNEIRSQLLFARAISGFFFLAFSLGVGQWMIREMTSGDIG